MSTSTLEDKLSCLLCLRRVDDISEWPSSTTSHHQPHHSFFCPRKIVVLFQLMHPKFSNSILTKDSIDDRECFVCNECAVFTNQMDELYEQLSQLKVQLKLKVVLLRTKILDSDATKNVEHSHDLDTLLLIRQSILRLSDEGDSSDFLPNDVKVKIETDDPVDEFLDACSPSAFLLYPDNDDISNDGDDGVDSDNYPFTITPIKRQSEVSRRVEMSPRKRGRRRTEVTEIHSSRKNPVRKAQLNMVFSDTSANCETETESDSTEMQVEEDLKGNSDENSKEVCKLPIKCHSTDELLANHNHAQKFHKSFDCHICMKRFRTKRARSIHAKSEHRAVFKCTLCIRKFFRKGSLQAHIHMRHETNEKNLICHKCDKRFTLDLNLTRHLELHALDKEKPLICEVCDSRFASISHLERHATTHNNKAYICSYCKKGYSSKGVLTRHQRIHTGELPYQCQHCEARFIDRAGQQWHTAKVHSTPDQYHLCPVCGKSFFSAYILKTHLDRHNGKQKACKECGDKFYDASSLKTHCIQKHGDEPLICDECGAKFMTEKGLKKHKMSHAGEKPHKCDVCDARFLSKWVLTNHMRSHTGERPYVCHHCGKGFKAKKHLDTHIKRIHSEDYILKTPFICSYCGKLYPRKGILDGHIRQNHTGERPYVCEVCSKGFALNTTLRLHLKSHGIDTTVRGERLPRSKREIFSQRLPEKEEKILNNTTVANSKTTILYGSGSNLTTNTGSITSMCGTSLNHNVNIPIPMTSFTSHSQYYPL